MSFYDRKAVHSSWDGFFDNNIEQIDSIYEKILSSGDEYTPEKSRVLRFAGTDLQNVKVVILGQDPYPQPGAATGRSFEVSGMKSWTEPIRQTSFRNILRAIYAVYEGEAAYTEIRDRIKRGEFRILPPDRLFDSLEAQGVLFLNTYLTCRCGAPLSHRALWKPVADELIKYISEQNRSAVWFLWGNDARSYAPLIGERKIYASRHPMMCGNYEDDFLRNPGFRETSDVIDWRGVE